MAEINQKDLVFVKELIETGKVTPVIDPCYPLSETAEAFRYFAEVHPRGKVVVSLNGGIRYAIPPYSSGASSRTP
jgi:NADPH:quinone reductase-like Zn-dependent oxidoreductase